nr:GPI ethanolamine phosphate transferase 2 [Onthophagus taurus]
MISYYVLSILSILLYLYSFFPIAKINTSSPSFHNQTNFNLTPLSEPTIDRLVLVVIDALRYDFVNPENMPYLSSLSKNNGCSSLVKVESPTVTLPRIKALTTGSVPQFIDVVLNLVRVDSVEDSFLHGAVKKGKKVVFYGDDTWLKAYSDLFLRSEGTSSFFVNDFSEVDDNVTRNVYNEIALKDWDIMILHYLGLDHIGHIYGPFHSLIQPKLQEMDLIIKTIHRNINSDGKKVLFAVTGDHGMKDSGGHGGTTYSETHVPLVLNGIECENDKIDQIDIPVIFSSLLGLEFPKNSIGKLSMNLLKKSLTKEKLLLFYFKEV